MCEQPKPPILTLPPPLSVDVAVLPVPGRGGRDTSLSHVRSISSQRVATATPVVGVQQLTSINVALVELGGRWRLCGAWVEVSLGGFTSVAKAVSH